MTWALTGDRQTGEDLAQATLERLWRRWERVSAEGDAWAYTERIATSLYATWWRRKWRHHETVTNPVPEVAAPQNMVDRVGDVDAINRWLDRLPARQRAVIVLRFLCDLSTEEAATAMGCSTGTIKSQTFKALRSLKQDAQHTASAQGVKA